MIALSFCLVMARLAQMTPDMLVPWAIGKTLRREQRVANHSEWRQTKVQAILRQGGDKMAGRGVSGEMDAMG